MKWLRAVGDLMAPRECIVCGRKLGVQEEHLCTWCAADLPLTRYWTRPHNPMADRFNECIERHRADTDVEPYAFAAALIHYRGESPYRRIPQALKYRYNLSAGRHFARMLGTRLRGEAHWQDVDLVIPVPLHRARRFERGYNQAEVIGREIARCLGVPCDGKILERKRRTRTQTRLSNEEKARNVSRAFRVRPAAMRKGLRARHILLIDDTFTTGATLLSCFAALREAFGSEVRISAATLAAVTNV